MDGSKYDGDWRQNVKEGKGFQRFPNGDTYTGHWDNGQRHGMGVYIKAGGHWKHEGHWHCNLRHGTGTLTDAHGVFTGEWRRDVKEGSGVWKWRSGPQGQYEGQYEGQWRGGVPDGKGELVNGSQRITVEWRDGFLVSPRGVVPLLTELPFLPALEDLHFLLS